MAAREAMPWERDTDRAWEKIAETEDGRLITPAASAPRRAGGAVELVGDVKRNLIRYVYLIVDMSKACERKDLGPASRLDIAVEDCVEFIARFFDQNPLSSVGVICARNSVAAVVTELAMGPRKHIDALRAACGGAAGGDFSLQLSLDVARELLCLIPAHGNREVVVLQSANNTVDPGDIAATTGALARDRVRVSFVALGAAVRVAQVVAGATGGEYGVATSREHARELLFAHLVPPAKAAEEAAQQVRLVRMGFPTRVSGAGAWCACHNRAAEFLFECPRCASRVCELPSSCAVCSLQLVSAPLLARSYHHLFPVAPYTHHDERRGGAGEDDDMAGGGAAAPRSCFGCHAALMKAWASCAKCGRVFCDACDSFVHGELHNCPGCCLARSSSSSSGVGAAGE